MKQYFILFGNDRYHPEDHFNNSIKFNDLKSARDIAKIYTNASVFRMYDNGTVSEMKLYNRKK